MGSLLPPQPLAFAFPASHDTTPTCHSPTTLTRITTEDSSAEYQDDEFVSLLARLDLADAQPYPRPPPRTPSPRPANRPVEAPHSFPTMHSRSYVTDRRTVYRFESPTQEGHTYSWSRAGVATQGVPNAFVREVQTGTANKSRGKKVAYVVYCGIRTGVFRSWRETQPLVNGVSNCIYRGYTSLAQAEAAFSYALQRSWVRTAGTPLTPGISQLPQPITSTADPTNPINGSETCDDKWYVVYHGITPGVYRSHLECQLNTLGVRGALHKGIIGRAAAINKYLQAVDGFEVGEAAPPEYSVDVFL
ncbi:hypothetical protein C8R43DRAFT_1143204 [Mycena crocata]|nr:hypothetical protein C8R43DRAFT_1143204 [Mycena crocata]